MSAQHVEGSAHHHDVRLEELQGAGYIHEIPIDPVTDQKDWQLDTGDDPGSTEGGQGITNVHSASSELSSDGSTRYSDW